MLKMYLQLVAVLGSLAGAISCAVWFGLFVMYAWQLTAAEKSFVINWTMIAFVGLALVVCVVGFVYSVKWVNRTTKKNQEKLTHLAEFKNR